MYELKKTSPILITGATGFLGSYISTLLVENGYTNLHATHRETSDFSLVTRIKDKINWIVCDFSDISSIHEVTRDKDVIIHSAAAVSFKKSDVELLMKSNATLTADLVNAALQNNIKRFIHISSIAAIGRSLNEDFISEKTDWSDGPLNSDYAISKRFAELEVWRGAAEGLNMCILNPSLIIGAGFWDKGTPSIFTRLKKGVTFFPTGANGVVDVRDVAKSVLLALEKNVSNKRIIISAENVYYRDFFQKIASVLKAKIPSRPLSPLLVNCYSAVDKLLNIFGTELGFVSAKQLKSLSFESRYDNKISVEELGLKYRDLEVSINDIVQNFDATNKDGFGKLQF